METTIVAFPGTANTTFPLLWANLWRRWLPFQRNDVSSGNGICEFSISRRIMSACPNLFCARASSITVLGSRVNGSGVFES